MAHDHITALRHSLQLDRSLPYRRYPDQALYALLDNRVQDAIKIRMDEGATLKGIHALEHNFSTGLNQIYFEFAPRGAIALAPDAFLIILNSSNKVVCVVDPFDPIQPNHLLPPLPTGGLLPFVLARPSAQHDVIFSANELQVRDAATREFFRKLQSKSRISPHMENENGDGDGEDGGGGDGGSGGGGGDGGSGGGGGDGGAGGGGGSHSTQSTYSTSTQGFPTTTSYLTGLLAPDFQADYNDPDVHADQMTDDSS